ncbi:MAG: RNA-binding protein [Candidatus Omnitrophica bacterium]|jgi:cold-inducible RNA-binding protein|nr:RNA-binding protein [Candidatus Omnitrophota bacterium]
MNSKLYVGNLSFQADDNQVRDHFVQYGDVASVNVVRDSYTGRSRGFAFVEMATEEAAQKAKDSAHGQPFMERNLTVDFAKPKTEGGPRGDRGPRRDFGGDRGDRGGFGGGGDRGPRRF